MDKKNIAIAMLRLGLGVTFILTGYFILSDPERWTYFLSNRTIELLPTDPRTAMTAAAFFDIFLGLWLISGMFLWLASTLAVIHLVQVLMISGLGDATYRDIGLAFSAVTLLIYHFPEKIARQSQTTD